MKIIKTKFGETRDKEEVYVYKLFGKNIEVEVLNYGCIIKSIFTPDKNGNFKNIVASFNDFESYENCPVFVGCITGRVAGRIKKGILKIKEDVYQLEANEGKNHLHGGRNSLNKKVWKVFNIEEKQDLIKITFNYVSPHLENNYPGKIDLYVTYIVSNDTLKIEYSGFSDRETYINLTNHTFFNLSGDCSQQILDHKIKVMADKVIKIDNEKLPIKIEDINKTNFDLKNFISFRELLSIEDKQLEYAGNGLDHSFILNESEKIKCICQEIESGRYIAVETDQPVVVIYTGNSIRENIVFYNNIKAIKHFGFCLETQDYPDIQNIHKESMKLYNKNNPYIQNTTFKFGIIR
ncbi:MAG: aldose epimerase family protein [Cetobacterium sp.]|uniref:aldose epimerase family protein n=1 Tax=Cetobacterium sp. TaxID=2071632 RepID=UPI003F2A64D5